MTATVKVVATQANIHIRFIYVNISALKEDRYKMLLTATSFFVDTHLSLKDSRETSYNVSIPPETLPGLLYGETFYQWSVEEDIDTTTELNSFPATYIQNKPYEELRQHYETLNNLFDELQDNYTELEGNYTDLQQKCDQLEGKQIGESNATSLMYLFLVTTTIFVVTSFLLLAKSPKATTW